MRFSTEFPEFRFPLPEPGASVSCTSKTRPRATTMPHVRSQAYSLKRVAARTDRHQLGAGAKKTATGPDELVAAEEVPVGFEPTK